MARSLEDFLHSVNSDTLRVSNQFQINITTGYSDIDAMMEDTLLFGQSFSIP